MGSWRRQTAILGVAIFPGGHGGRALSHLVPPTLASTQQKAVPSVSHLNSAWSLQLAVTWLRSSGHGLRDRELMCLPNFLPACLSNFLVISPSTQPLLPEDGDSLFLPESQ